jgi:hypothetical protein
MRNVAWCPKTLRVPEDRLPPAASTGSIPSRAEPGSADAAAP